MMKPAFFFLIPFLVDFVMAGTGIVVNFYAQDLQASPRQLGMLGFAWGIPYMMCCIVIGRLADRWPRRLLMAAGLALATIVVNSYQYMTSPSGLILLNVAIGAVCALFWPVFETLLHSSDKHTGNRTMGLFNIGWTLGIGGGAAIGGFLSQWDTALGLDTLSSVTLATLGLLLFATRNGIPPLYEEKEESAPLDPDASHAAPSERATYLYLAWTANFTLWFAAGGVNALFPKLCRSLLIPDHTSGMLLALIMAGQAVSFFLIARTTAWHYRLGPMVAFQLLATLGCVLVASGESPTGFALAMILMGIGRGLTYSCSLYYGLAAESGKGANAGIHEMLIGVSSALGPLVSGEVAQVFGLRAPFYLCGAVGLIGVILELLIWKRVLAVRVSPDKR